MGYTRHKNKNTGKKGKKGKRKELVNVIEQAIISSSLSKWMYFDESNGLLEKCTQMMTCLVAGMQQQ